MSEVDEAKISGIPTCFVNGPDAHRTIVAPNTFGLASGIVKTLGMAGLGRSRKGGTGKVCLYNKRARKLHDYDNYEMPISD